MTAPWDREQDSQTWRRRLEDASVLPHDDPLRQRVEVEVAQRGGWTRAQWLALIEEGERLRLEVANVPVPEGLEDRLLSIPAEMRARPVRDAIQSRPVWVAVAAVLLVGLALAFVLTDRQTAQRQDGVVMTVALLAVNDHVNTHTQDVLAEDLTELAAGLQAHIPFPVVIPDLGPTVHAIGGRRCSLGSHTVAFTAWRAPGGRITLIQMRREDFGLPADMAPTVARPTGPGAGVADRDVLFFGQGDTVWVLVADDPNDIVRVRAALHL